MTSKLSCRNERPGEGSRQESNVSRARYAQEKVAGNASNARHRFATRPEMESREMWVYSALGQGGLSTTLLLLR
jgi:hypothetical protein